MKLEGKQGGETCDEELDFESFYCDGFGTHYCSECAEKTESSKGKK